MRTLLGSLKHKSDRKQFVKRRPETHSAVIRGMPLWSNLFVFRSDPNTTGANAY